MVELIIIMFFVFIIFEYYAKINKWKKNQKK